MSQNQVQSIVSQQQTSEGHSSTNNKSIVSADGQIRCIICLKKYSITSCKQCTRCAQVSCKSCFKVDSKSVTQIQKKLFNSNNIGKCCFSDLIFQQNILSDTTVQWGKDSLTSINWCSNDHLEDHTFIDPKMEQDNYFELCVELSNTKYKEHLEMKVIEKEIFEEDIYSKKNMNRSFAEFLNTVQADGTSDKVKQDQVILLKSFVSFMLEQRETPEDKIYLRGQGMLALFLLCFCSIKKSFYIMKEIYQFFYVDILHPDQIKKEINYCSIVKHIVFIYLENFQKKKDPSAQFIERIVAFTRKYLYFQYNFFFLNQLNLSCAFQILEQLFLQRSHEVMTRAMTSIIHLNIKVITEGDLEKINMKDMIYNKVQPEILQPCLLQQWIPLRKEAIYKIIEEHYNQCELEKYKKYECGADEIERAVKTCVKKQKNEFKLMEEHYKKEIKDLKSALKLAIGELKCKVEKIQRIEVEKNNIIVKFQSLKVKYEVNEIEYEDIQAKLQFLNERTSKRQMHYNKEYEAQILTLQQQVKNQKLDYKELEMMYKNQQASIKEQLEDKDNIIKRLKQGIHLLQRQRNEVNIKDKAHEQLQEVYELCKNHNSEEQDDNDREENDSQLNTRIFHSYFQPSARNSLATKAFERTPPLSKQVQSQNNSTPDKSQSQSWQIEQDQNATDETEDEQQYYAVSGKVSFYKQKDSHLENSSHLQNSCKIQADLNQAVQQEIDQSSNDQLSQSVLEMYKSCSIQDPVELQQAINQMQHSPQQSIFSERNNDEEEDERQYVSNLEHPYFSSQHQHQQHNNIKQQSFSAIEPVTLSPHQQIQISNSSLYVNGKEFRSPSQQQTYHKQQNVNSASPLPHNQYQESLPSGMGNELSHSQNSLQSPNSIDKLSSSQLNNQQSDSNPSPNTQVKYHRYSSQRAQTQVEILAHSNLNGAIMPNVENQDKYSHHKKPLSISFYPEKDNSYN